MKRLHQNPKRDIRYNSIKISIFYHIDNKKHLLSFFISIKTLLESIQKILVKLKY